MVKVLVSGRVIDKQVGGNTRYARAVYSGIGREGVEFEVGRPALRTGRLWSASYALWEGVQVPRLRLSEFDVIHFPADTGALVPSRTPVVGTIHGLATLHLEGVRKPLQDAVWKRRVRSLAEHASQIITVSQSSADDIVRVAPGTANKITPIHHGIDHERFNPIADPGDQEALRELNIEGEYFLYLGNLDPRKNVVELCVAAERVFATTGIPLLVAGAPAWDSDLILDKVKNTPGVRYLGRVSEAAILPLLRGATAFCFPSKYEGFGFPVVEAMACGAPVICSDRGSLKEVAGGAGLILPSIGASDIEHAMMQVARDSSLRTELRRAGLKNAQRFKWSESIRAHAEVFKEAAR